MAKTIYSKEHKRLASALRKVRIASGLTQQEAAEKIARTQSFISKVESGEQKLDAIELKTMAQLYRKDLADLL